ncbi:MAG TPA: alkaline phosphatase family protein [Burkholderiaceae bacterium]|nr:alkaline phosphatase family protein [Burkholderiaceae bacterium]
MRPTKGLGLLAAGALAAVGLSCAAWAETEPVKQVLIISVDGLHAVDVEQFIRTHKESALAEIVEHSVRYTTAATSRPSDSFPGVLSILTGGSPASADVFYDVSWDRTQWPPGPAGCTGTQGQQTTYDETIDLLKVVNGLAIDQNQINPDLLPWGIKDGTCQHIYPHDFVKVNTIFDVVKAAGGRTAWADKHAAYDLVTGPTGKAVDDLYTPEVTNPQTLNDSMGNPIPGPYVGQYGVMTDSNGTHVTPDATVSVNCTLDNDRLKFNALIAEINGYNHTGTGTQVGTPTVFGTDLQAISVGQKVSHNNTDGSCYAPDPKGLDGATPHTPLTGKPGGYVDGSGKPTEVLEYALEQTDAQLGQVVAALKARSLYDSTIIVITAKHGQTPIDPLKTNKIGGLQTLVAAYASPSDAVAQAIVTAGENEDDIALIWLQDQSQAAAAAQWLRDNSAAAWLHIQQVLAGDLLKLRFRDPTTDNHTPDIIVVPELGVIYTTSKKKNEEHGGFSNDDTNVALIVSQPGLHEKVIKGAVLTTQIAPTVLKVLGLDPNGLQSVQIEHTEVLPGLGL